MKVGAWFDKEGRRLTAPTPSLSELALNRPTGAEVLKLRDPEKRGYAGRWMLWGEGETGPKNNESTWATSLGSDALTTGPGVRKT